MKFKEKQKRDFDRRHRVKDLTRIPDETSVWVRSGTMPATPSKIVSPDTSPRSYRVVTPSGILRRNRAHFSVKPDNDTPPVSHQPPPGNTIMTRLKTGTAINPPSRYTK